MATAPAGDDRLTPDNPADILDELVPAQNQSYVLGLKLGLPLHGVDSIHSTYLDPHDRLLHVIIVFLKQVQPRPTWRVIVDALSSPAVNLPRLAKRVEAAHFPDPTSARDAVPETTTVVKSVATTDISYGCTSSEQSSGKRTTTEWHSMVHSSNKRPMQANADRKGTRLSQETELVQAKDRELAQAQQQLREKEEQLRFIAALVADLRLQLTRKEEELTRAEGTIKREQQETEAKDRELSEKKKQLKKTMNSETKKNDLLRNKKRELVDQRQKESELLQTKEKLQKRLTHKDRMLQTNEKKLSEVERQLSDKDKLLQTKDRTLSDKDKMVQAKEKELAYVQQQLKEKDSDSEKLLQTLCEAQQEIKQQKIERDDSIKSKEREVAKAKQQMREKEIEKDKELQAKNDALDKALKQLKITKKQLQATVKEEEQQLREKEERLQSSEALVVELKRQLTVAKMSFRCQISGPGLQSATVNHSTHVIVELTDSSGRPASPTQNVTAQLETVSEGATHNSTSNKTNVSVAMMTHSRYEVTYTPVSRGRHKLPIQVNKGEIIGSPFTMTVYPDPTQLGHPVRTVTGLSGPYGIAINKCREIIISEKTAHRVSIFNIRGEKRTFGSRGDSPHQMILPAGIASDEMDNIYVSSQHKLQKFTSSGELIKCVGKEGRKEGEFNNPRGVTIYNNQVYVCDRNSNRIQVFDLDLNFIRSIGSHGTGENEFDQPFDVKFDTAENMYVVEYGNKRVQVMDTNGHFIQSFGQEGQRKLDQPSALYISGKYVYVSDLSHHCVVVYDISGQFVSYFGRHGKEKGDLSSPYCITSCDDSLIHVCDSGNTRVQIF